jgi:hypothetical protein
MIWVQLDKLTLAGRRRGNVISEVLVYSGEEPFLREFSVGVNDLIFFVSKMHYREPNEDLFPEPHEPPHQFEGISFFDSRRCRDLGNDMREDGGDALEFSNADARAKLGVQNLKLVGREQLQH